VGSFEIKWTHYQKTSKKDIENAFAAEKRRAVASLPTSLRKGLGNVAYPVPKKKNGAH